MLNEEAVTSLPLPTLSPRETRDAREHLLAQRYLQDGDDDAASDLVAMATPLAHSIARRFLRPGIELEDLQAEATLGLVLALRRFDPSHGVPFSRYAAWWAKAMVLRHIEKNATAVTLGGTRNVKKMCYQLEKERRRRRQEGRPTHAPALATALGVSEEEVRAFDVARHGPTLSLRMTGASEPGIDLEERLPEETFGDPEAALMQAERQATLESCLDRFAETLDSDRDRHIWAERLRAVQPSTQLELGHRFGVTKQRISQIERGLWRKLDAWMATDPTCQALRA